MGLDKKPKRVNRTDICKLPYRVTCRRKKTFIQPIGVHVLKKPERKTDKTYTVAIAYNKGVQVISPKDIKDIGK